MSAFSIFSNPVPDSGFEIHTLLIIKIPIKHIRANS